MKGNGPNEREAWGVIAIQKAQVEDVCKQIEKSEATLQQAATEIISRVNSLDTECLLLKKFEEVTAASNGSMELSFRMMDDTERLVAGAISSSQEFYQSMGPLGQLTTTLTGTLEALSNQMRLIALNAQVQAVQIGKGTGLEVLSAHTATVSDETSTVADKISSGIGQMLSILRDLSASFQSTVARGEETVTTLNQCSSAHRQRLHSLRDRTLEKLRTVGDAVDEIRRCATLLSEESTVRGTALTSLQELFSTLKEIDAEFKKGYGRLDAATAARASTGSYRMKSERMVHEAVLNKLAAQSKSRAVLDTKIETSATAEAEPSVELF